MELTPNRYSGGALLLSKQDFYNTAARYVPVVLQALIQCQFWQFCSKLFSLTPRSVPDSKSETWQFTIKRTFQEKPEPMKAIKMPTAHK